MNNLEKSMFIDRFSNRQDVHAEQWVSRNTGRHGYQPFPGALDEHLLELHLSQKTTLGAYTTSETNNSLWGCFDFDFPAEDEIHKIQTWLFSRNIRSMRESVKPDRSGHLWVFCDRPIQTQLIYRIFAFLRFLYAPKCEIYPKQPELKGTGPGNLVRIPLGVNQKPDAKGAVGLFQDCSSINVYNQLSWFIEQPINDAEKIIQIAHSLPKGADKPTSKKKSNKQAPLLDEFPEDWGFKDKGTGEFIGRCPCCAEFGFDVSCDNLSLNIDKNVLICYGGCSFKDIMQSLNKLKSCIIA